MPSFQFSSNIENIWLSDIKQKKNKNNKITYKFKCIPKSLEPFEYKIIKYNLESKQ